MTLNQRLLLVITLLLLTVSVKSISEQSFPSTFSWDDFNGQTYLSTVHNQNFPYACNSGWAFSTISMIESRIKRQRKAQSPDITLSTQILLSCDTLDYGCLGGQPINALRWIKRNNITDQTCHSYIARGYTQGEKCTSQTKCQKCNIKATSCKSQQNSKIYSIFDYGFVGNQQENQIMTQISTYGPIVCGIAVTNQFKNYTQGIFQDKTGNKGPNHYVLIYGWGQQNGTKFWYGRNSWGSNWGINGNFKIIRGINNLGIQNLCYWGGPLDTWTNDIRNQSVPQQNVIRQSQVSNKINYPLPSYLTHSRNSLTPHYCQSSWAISLIQMIRDRISRNSKGKLNIDFSVQALLNCGLGSCDQQIDPFDALSYINKYGIPEQNCQSYKAQKPLKTNCTTINNCATCTGTAFKSNCTAISSFKRWKINDFSSLSGQKQMMNQINANGPILCGIDKNSTAFNNYQGGIMTQLSVAPKLNHYVEVVGFGEENGNNYWIARNTWGTAWGEEGFFRIKRGGSNLGIEKRCLRAHISLNLNQNN